MKPEPPSAAPTCTRAPPLPPARPGARSPGRSRAGRRARRPLRRARRQRHPRGCRTRSARRAPGRVRVADDPRLGCRDCENDDEDGDAEAVVEPALDVEPLPHADGRLGSVTTAWPRAASVGARITASSSASGHSSPPKTASAATKPGADRQRQADPEQPGGHADLLAERLQVDPRCVAEEHDGEGGLGQELDRLAARRRVDDPEDLRAEEQAGAGEHHRRGDRGAFDQPGHGCEAEHDEGNGGNGPLHGEEPIS